MYIYNSSYNNMVDPYVLYIPGVSIMLMFVSFHVVYVAADCIRHRHTYTQLRDVGGSGRLACMVIPLCLSSSMESIVAPTLSFPLTYSLTTTLSFTQMLTFNTLVFGKKSSILKTPPPPPSFYYNCSFTQFPHR